MWKWIYTQAYMCAVLRKMQEKPITDHSATCCQGTDSFVQQKINPYSDVPEAFHAL